MSPWNPKLYPPDWPEIVKRVAARSAGRCECRGECGKDHGGRCRARNGEPLGGYRVVLTSAHLWRGPCAEHHRRNLKCGDLTHLAHLCQRCHLIYDLPHHVARAKRTRKAKKATGDLFVSFPPLTP